MWPFSERIDPRYKTVKTITFAGNYIFQPFTQVDPLYIRYNIIADIEDRDVFTTHELLEEKNTDKYLSTVIGCEIYQCLVPYHVHYEEDGYYSFHKIIDFGMKKMTISQETVSINSLIENIKETLYGEVFFGIKITDFVFIQAIRTSPKPKQLSLKEVKEVEGKYIALDEIRKRKIQIYDFDIITIVPIAFDNHIHIQWLYKKSLGGNLIICRRTGGFSPDRYSLTGNGDIIVDNDEPKYVYGDYEVSRGVTYSYNVNFKYKYLGFSGRKNEVEGVDPKLRHITRFQARLLEKEELEEKEEPKSSLEILKEEKKIELDKHIIEQSFNEEIDLRNIISGISSHERRKYAVDEYIEDSVKKYEEKITKEKPRLSKKEVKEKANDFRMSLEVIADNIRSGQ